MSKYVAVQWLLFSFVSWFFIRYKLAGTRGYSITAIRFQEQLSHSRRFNRVLSVALYLCEALEDCFVRWKARQRQNISVCLLSDPPLALFDRESDQPILLIYQTERKEFVDLREINSYHCVIEWHDTWYVSFLGLLILFVKWKWSFSSRTIIRTLPSPKCVFISYSSVFA